MPYTTITTEGGLLPVDILDTIAAEELAGQRAEDFGLEKGRRLGDEIAAAWGDIRVFWDGFQRGLRRLRESDTATSITREQWMIPFLRALGYELKYVPSAALVEGRTYAISHRAGDGDAAPPVHVEGIRTSLDARPPTGRPRLSPHALVQEYLNSTEHLWGIVTNGERLRLLRDSSRMTRPAYVEFDLGAMLEGEKFSEFAVLYRLLHRTRMPCDGTDATACHLECYHQLAIESGGRVREKLSVGVEQALKLLGNGLLQHPANAALRAKVAAGDGHGGPSLSPLDFYRQLLRLVYRLLFLMVAEERNLIAAEDDVSDPLSPLAYRPPADDRLAIYRQHYSIGRLRRMAEQRGAGRGPYDDLWLALMQTFRLLEGSDEESPRKLGLAALDGDLFSAQAIADLEGTRVRNADLLQALAALSLYSEKESKTLRRVNYAALDVEELGSVYESLLDYRPVITGIENTELRIEKTAQGAGYSQFSILNFQLVTGTERKTTGSYYTRPELVHELIKSALDPVIEERLKAATTDHRPPTTGQRTSSSGADSRSSVVGRQSSAQEQALLSIRVCDPAAGSGHFLLAAARRIGRALAKVRSGEEQPTPTEFRRAVRDVIQHCIYGVDLNPLAVDLCKLALWIEGHNAGMPLSFLDHHIKQGNSLIGATRALVDNGIPDDAYKAVTGDDKKVASEIKKRNKAERERYLLGAHQHSLFEASTKDGGAALADALRQLDDMSSGSVAEVRAKAVRYRQVRAEAETELTRFNLWTAAFFQPLTPENAQRIPTTAMLADYERSPRVVRADLIGAANGLAAAASFFHWELEFPQVFEPTTDHRPPTTGDGERRSSVVGRRSSGFDVVLGNPPWERIKLQEQEHWVDVVEVRDAPNKAAREKVIQAWRSGDERQRARVALFDAAKYRAEAESRFVRASGRFPLTAVGDVNTYALFAEHARDLLAPTGRAGIIVPTGIATDDTTKEFFGDINQRRQLASLYDFENRENMFPGVGHGVFKFSLITLGITDRPTNFLFFATNVRHLQDKERAFTLSVDEISLLNPNTRTCPVFRTHADAELTKKIYRRVPVLLNEHTGQNLWHVSFMRMLDMANDSDLFHTVSGEKLVPLYEAKMFWHYDHRFGDYSDYAEDAQSNALPKVPENRLQDPCYVTAPRYWVKQEDLEMRLSGVWEREWLLAFRDITKVQNERTVVFNLLPKVGVGHTAPLMFINYISNASVAASFLATVNSLTFDYVARQKMGGTHLTYTIANQLPVLPPTAFSAEDIAFIVPRVLELVYTAWDMRPFAEDVWAELTTDDRPPTTDRRPMTGQGSATNDRRPSTAGGEREEDLSGLAAAPQRHGQNPTGLAAIRAEILRRNAECNKDAPRDLFPATPGVREDGSVDFSILNSQFSIPPFRWSDERRALIRAELDARIARLYGLTRDELRYILDPADVYGPDFPGETFRVLKEKETRQFGEYRTRRLVLEAWDREDREDDNRHNT
jgi:hypothetical protein